MAQACSKKCDLCEDNDGSYFCYECKHALCTVCRGRHNKIPAISGHTITEIHKVDILTLKTKSCCDTHGKEYVFYCNKCKCLICSKCLTTNHKDHEFFDIDQVVSEERSNAIRMVSESKEKIKIILEMKDKVENTYMKDLQTNTKQIKDEMEHISQEVQFLVESKMNIKITEAEDFEHLERQQYEYFLRNADHLVNKYTSVCSEMENLLSENHNITFHICYVTIKSDVENLDAIPEEPVVNQLTFNSSQWFKDITEFLSSKSHGSLCDSCKYKSRKIEEISTEVTELRKFVKKKLEQKDEEIFILKRSISEAAEAEKYYLEEILQLANPDDQKRKPSKDTKKYEHLFSSAKGLFKCKVCNKRFSSAFMLYSHKYFCHIDPKHRKHYV